MLGTKKRENHTEHSANITTLIAENCTVKGSISADEFMKIDGKILGSVESTGGVILGRNALVKGDVNTKELTVCGKIEGNVFADKLILKSTATINGDISVKSLQMETGSVYNGNVSMGTQTQPQNQLSPQLQISKEPMKKKA
ncbi:MAG: polymer-forming cytoskeletal protein [Dysgonamonadaceae bacterium]|jgi:cytoskeletal protein CcmA (bactofilin family)|nr:polymer-forming cytoskeletal protein [Dysgonamonadaceae bacterium]